MYARLRDTDQITSKRTSLRYDFTNVYWSIRLPKNWVMLMRMCTIAHAMNTRPLFPPSLSPPYRKSGLGMRLLSYLSLPSKIPWGISAWNGVDAEDRVSVRANLAKETGFTGLSILHRLYYLYGFNVLCDLVFDAMHNIPLNVVSNHLHHSWWGNYITCWNWRLKIVPWTPGNNFSRWNLNPGLT